MTESKENKTKKSSAKTTARKAAPKKAAAHPAENKVPANNVTMTYDSSKERILFAAFEAVPFIKTGGLGDVAGSLPAALNKLGADVRLIMPKFATIPQKFKDQMVHVADFYMPLGWRSQFVGIETITYNGVIIYFIDNEYYFYRDQAYGYYDDGERIAFFSRAILESLKYLDFSPQIIHCNDWHTALVPAFLRGKYGFDVMKAAPGEVEGRPYSDIRTIFTVHNLKFQGMFSGYMIGDVLGFSQIEAENQGLVCGDAVNFMRSALSFADRITTVSPTYANEVCTDFYGENAQDIFNSRRNVLHGILNGIDTKALDPETDPMIPYHFCAGDCLAKPSDGTGSISDQPHIPEGKIQAKMELQKKLGLQVNPDKPIFSIISRLTDQKGLDLVLAIIDEFMQMDVQFVVLGVGESKYEDKFRSMGEFMPDKFAACLYFDEPLSHQIYAASDFMLVPSLFEPCGLTQIIAMRYGTLPIVRETGGLKDTVRPYNKFDGSGTGFTFANYNAHELLFTMKDANDLYYNDKNAFCRLVSQAMNTDFSWDVSAKKYLELYKELI